jgi:hypothetical protein
LVPIETLSVCQVNEEDVAFTQEDQDADPRSVRIRKNDLTVWRREIDYRGSSLTFSIRRNSKEKSILLEAVDCRLLGIQVYNRKVRIQSHLLFYSARV